MKNDIFQWVIICIVTSIFWAAISHGISAQETKSKRNMTIDDYFKIKNVDSPQISPDGKWVAFTVREADLKKDKSEVRFLKCTPGSFSSLQS